jgi:hypothetical protein
VDRVQSGIRVADDAGPHRELVDRYRGTLTGEPLPQASRKRVAGRQRQGAGGGGGDPRDGAPAINEDEPAVSVLLSDGAQQRQFVQALEGRSEMWS